MFRIKYILLYNKNGRIQRNEFGYKEMFAIKQIEKQKGNKENTKSICSLKSFVCSTFNC